LNIHNFILRKALYPAAIVILIGVLTQGFCMQGFSPRVDIIPRGKIQRGTLLLATYRGPASFQPTGILTGKSKFLFFKDRKGLARAFVAVPLNGRKSQLIFTLAVSSGKSVRKSKFILKVYKKNMPTKHIHLPEKMTRLSKKTLEKIHRERKALLKVLHRVSLKKRWNGRFMRPVDGRITSVFGARRRINGSYYSVHHGVDFRARPGTPIHAVNTGKVVFCGSLLLTGNTVVLDHGLGLFSLYAHLKSITVKRDDIVRKNTILGYSGNTGRSTGPHLHLGITLSGIAVDPLSLINLSL